MTILTCHPSRNNAAEYIKCRVSEPLIFAAKPIVAVTIKLRRASKKYFIVACASIAFQNARNSSLRKAIM